jgi:hypothetical protein
MSGFRAVTCAGRGPQRLRQRGHPSVHFMTTSRARSWPGYFERCPAMDDQSA